MWCVDFTEYQSYVCEPSSSSDSSSATNCFSHVSEPVSWISSSGENCFSQVCDPVSGGSCSIGTTCTIIS